MKTNLDSMFKTDAQLESDGVWFDVTKEISFKLRRMGGNNTNRAKQAFTKYCKPYVRLIENDTLPQADMHAINVKVFIDTCLVEWQGIKDEAGNEIVLTFDNALALLIRLPELFNTLSKYVNGFDSFREEREDLGNS